MTSPRTFGSRCARTKAEASVIDEPIPSIVCRTSSGKTETTARSDDGLSVPALVARSNRIGASEAPRAPASEVRSTASVVTPAEAERESVKVGYSNCRSVTKKSKPPTRKIANSFALSIAAAPNVSTRGNEISYQPSPRARE